MTDQARLHRFDINGRRYALDPETCFCFECDEISWDVLEFYPGHTANAIVHLLEGRWERKEIGEVIGELEWLRAVRSILQTPRQEDLAKRFEITPGLREVYVRLAPDNPAPEAPSSPPPNPSFLKGLFSTKGGAPTIIPSGATCERVLEQAAGLLLARSAGQRELHLKIALPPGGGALLFAPGGGWQAMENFRRLAQCAGKRAMISIGFETAPLAGLPTALAGHELDVWVDWSAGKEQNFEAVLGKFFSARMDKLSHVASAMDAVKESVPGRIVFRPAHARFEGVVRALRQAGFIRIDIDIEGAFLAHPGLDPAVVMESLRANAEDYAADLLRGDHYRVEPMATLFLRIYHGTAEFRSDPAGVHGLAVDAGLTVYPGKGFLGQSAFAAGVLGAQAVEGLDESLLRRFEDVGALTTPACLRCWARGLCGGGSAVVHQALSGSFRQPHDAWCAAQRAWLEGAVAAFNTLSSAGVNFTRLHESLVQRPRLSLFTLAKAAVQLRLGLRPIEEADAEWLTRWENWNEAAYFTFNESGLMLATKYDREMDALHPRIYEQEFIITHRDGKPAGLIKFRGGALPGLALAWLYFRREADYAANGVRSSIRLLLREALKDRGMKAVIIPVGPKENALAECLQSVGFQPAGVLREALYLHGAYHDIRLFQIDTDQA